MSTHSQSPEPSAPLSSQTKHHGSGRHWTDEESALMEKHREEYRDANDAARAEIFSRVLQDMLDILPNGKSFKKEERSAVKKDIKEWFARYSRKRSQKMPRMGKSWHAQHVFQHENKDAIDTEAKRLCAEAIEEGQKRPKGGDPTHFDFRERVVTQMMGKLKKREKDVLQRTAEEYNKKGVDPELKSKLAVKNCTARMHAFSKELYDTMGVRVFILGCYLKPDGNLDVSTYDFNQELGNGKDFIDNHSQTFHEEGISDLDVDKPAKKRTEQFSKDDWTPDRDGSDDDGEDLDVEKPTKKPTKQHDEHREDGSDDSDSDSDNGQERPKQDTLTEPTVKPSRVNPTLEEDRDSGSDLGSDDATITVDTSPELQPRYNDTRALSHEVPSDTEVLADDTFWEADLGCGVESADRAKKRKFTDEEDTPCKFPQLEKGYKLGPRSARPGKVKCRAASAVIQATVKPAQATNLRSDTTKASNSFDFTKSSGVNAKRPVPSKQKESEAGPSRQPSIDVPTKPKPKPHPIIKGKVSTGELGIVTRERSKKIAEESVRSTWSKKVSFVS
ncbi:uncharacterized protein LACBIDRAFT_335227 [Laccaria bicolor S238N-H82]|uniref:Predicted protein n=1 Tax=Laccaria bicolor (strain S238N-H82 / ATCC MYA-4686) TaxID=486041 RepID=B0E1R4_LACBS|nr:uncharacterized protein LACBIDRAFT_335227 [Laccaria bicolor S238N-H82]EDQ99218.1 predicted protein [Laccaria bicolor S238N-H82]|eukprot:XP_001890115.1 predicted protein [Laccaria bicolor S238N-H82]